ncbi:MAG: ABC transporter substrate-binding protein [candidate division NC10 bacterium]|nr:ABC transporter substrate-binding protein [candidate division NC10 bacterium]
MKKDRLLVYLVLACIIWLAAGSSYAAEPIRIGALFPYTGNLAKLGNETFHGADIAREWINRHGGVLGRQVEWVKGDAVDAKAAVGEAERLITVEKVTVIFGTYSSSLSNAASEVAERHKIIYWEQGAIADNITARGFQYIFRTCPRASSFGVAAVEFTAQDLASQLGIKAKDLKIAIVHEDTLYGTSVGTAAREKAKEMGLNVVAVEPYSAKAVDLSSLIMKLQAKRPDVVIATSYMNDAILFWRQAKELNFHLKALVGTGAGHGMMDFFETFGKYSDGVFNVDFPVIKDPRVLDPKLRPSLAEFREAFRAKHGRDPAVHATAGFVGAMVLFQQVIPKAGSLNPQEIRKAALSLNIPVGGTWQGWGVKFAPPGHPAAGQNLQSFPMVMQWQGGQLYIVSPPKFKEREMILVPLPSWDQR